MSELRIRRARAADAVAVADIHVSSFRATYDFPLAHTDDEVRGWIRDYVVGQCQTWPAIERAPGSAAVVGHVVWDGSVVRQLDVMPGRTGEGVGSLLMARAKARRPAGLELWTFQVNAGARRFYERHGFTAAGSTDGADNEESQPDVRYRWRP